VSFVFDGAKVTLSSLQADISLGTVLEVQRLASEVSIDCGVKPPEVAQRIRICPSPPALAKQIRGSTPTHSRTAIQSPREKYFPLMISFPITFAWTDSPSSLCSCAPPLLRPSYINQPVIVAARHTAAAPENANDW
jgi:hypothetical protein